MPLGPDAQRWMVDFRDCLAGEFGQAWQHAAAQWNVTRVRRNDGTMWMDWRAMRELDNLQLEGLFPE